MKILKANTGDDKLDEAYKSIQVHICTFDSFETFYPYFVDIVKTDNQERLNKWLLKVLFTEFKYGRTESKHDFDLLLEKVSQKNKEQLELWLKTELEKVNNKGDK